MIKAYNVEIPGKGSGRKIGGPNIDDVLAFLASGAKNAEVELGKRRNKNITSVQSGYSAAIRRLGLMDKVGTMARSGRLFLVRKDVE